MDLKIEVGQQYRNRIGVYEVLAIQEPKIRIRYEDGHEDVVTIAVQERILRRILADEQQPEQGRVSKTKIRKRRRSWSQYGY